MEDNKIVDLYWQRNESAIYETQVKYGKMLYGVSYSLLSSREDAEECVNDTYYRAWRAMPDARPTYLGAFLAKIVRHLSLDTIKKRTREKRGGDTILAELSDCIPSEDTTESLWEHKHLTDLINTFLVGEREERRVMFIKRYFMGCSVEEIAREMHVTSSHVKVTLYRMREALKNILKKEAMWE